MGFLDLFNSSPEKRVQSLQKKATEKYGPPENRQKALDQLLELGTPEALGALLMRFTVASEPSITDAEEKDYVFKSLVGFGDKAVEPLKAFLRKSHLASSWALKMLKELVPAADIVTLCISVLEALGPEYTRDPQKKTVLIATLGEIPDARVTPALLPFLTDPSDDVRIAAAAALTEQKDERARQPLLEALVDSADRARVVAGLTEAIADCGFGVQGFREKVEKLLPEGYFVDRAGLLKKRG